MSVTRPSGLAFAVLAAAVTLAPPAEAKCGPPAPLMAPASGSVPPHPVLELLVPQWGVYEAQKAPPRLVAKGAGGAVATVTVKADTKAPALTTYRVEVAATQAGPLQVELLDDKGASVRSWSFVVDAGWRAPASSRAPISTRAVHDSWTCSETNTTNLSFDGGAAAYRVVAARSAADLAAGRTEAFVVPRAMSLFWEPAPSRAPAVDLELGQADCFGETFDWSKGAVVAKVFALLPNGTEQPVTDKPLALGKP